MFRCRDLLCIKFISVALQNIIRYKFVSLYFLSFALYRYLHFSSFRHSSNSQLVKDNLKKVLTTGFSRREMRGKKMRSRRLANCLLVTAFFYSIDWIFRSHGWNWIWMISSFSITSRNILHAYWFGYIQGW